ncbi:MAG: HDIG domain-containing protein [Treponema sp.]|nr:HDIG domain-containing protein [Treponema sp.]
MNFFKVATSESVASFAIEDFEIGQISDRTIVSDKELLPDDFNPVHIQKGEKVLKKGFPVTEESYEKLKKMVSSPVYLDKRSFANSELYIFILGVVWYLLLAFIYKGKKVKVREIVFQVILFTSTFSVSALCGKFVFFGSPYSICIIIPSSLSVVLTAILYGQMPAIMLSFIVSLGVLNGCSWALVPSLFTLLSSLCACGVVKRVERRIDMIFVSIMLAVSNLVFMIVMGVIFNETLSSMGTVLFGVVINGFLSGILTLGLITPLELMLNTSSIFRLMDLSDLNNTFMQTMLVQASGTYQHSMMVAQLAENACREIGANALVARVGSYYHDIGKLDQSEYFIENQKGENKHNSINPSLSATVIRSHVRKGIEKAYQLHLPQVVIDIISEHHGNSVISFFYNEALKDNPNANPADFSYTGNPPTTRESAVVMLADTVEAACRTLEDKSEPSLEAFMKKLFQSKIDSHQLDHCNLTFSDLAHIRHAFLQILSGYYHSRIEYPDQGEKKENTASETGTSEAKAEADSKKAKAKKTKVKKTEKK